MVGAHSETPLFCAYKYPILNLSPSFPNVGAHFILPVRPRLWHDVCGCGCSKRDPIPPFDIFLKNRANLFDIHRSAGFPINRVIHIDFLFATIQSEWLRDWNTTNVPIDPQNGSEWAIFFK